MLGSVVASPREIILSIDPAVLNQEDYDQYRESNYDESKLKLDPSNMPTRFKIKQIPTSLMRKLMLLAPAQFFNEEIPDDDPLYKEKVHRRLKAQSEYEDYALHVVACGLISANCYELQYEDGTVGDLRDIPKINHREYGTILDMSYLESIRLDETVIALLSEEIISYSTVLPPFLQTQLKAQSGAGEESKKRKGSRKK